MGQKPKGKKEKKKKKNFECLILHDLLDSLGFSLSFGYFCNSKL